MSCERVFEITAELGCLIEAQHTVSGAGPTLLEMSAEDLAACSQRSARIKQISKELEKLSYPLSNLADQKAEHIN
jgi:homoserine kinase